MKKTIALLIALITICSVIPVGAASFTDMDSKHWAFDAVSQLVDKGTIGGYPDGSYRPDNTVTRAEFVKMVGEGSEKRKNDYNDVPSSHWVYKYAITSGFASDDRNNFNPDVPITRGQTVELLYRRFGKSGAMAPYFVEKEAEKYGIDTSAISWIYTYGILVGDDGLNLRLSDTLTRAEAAALIIKCSVAEKQVNFVDIVSENILKNTFESINAFGEGYNSKQTVTNAQLAEAAVKFANNAGTIDFGDYYINKSIEHEKSRELFIMCNSAIGMDNFNVEFADATATFDTAEQAFKIAAERLNVGTVTQKAMLYVDGNKYGGDAVTHKELAAMMVQYDTVFGSQLGYTTELSGEEYTHVNFKIENDVRKYPQSYKDYAVILKGVPQQVYDFPRTTVGSGTAGTPAQLYDFAREYSALFTAKCAEYVMAAEAVFGSKIKITFYPSLAYNNGGGFAFRVKVTALNSAKCTPADMFGDAAITNRDTKMATGLEFYAEIAVDSII